jgi:hypothetical protein
MPDNQPRILRKPAPAEARVTAWDEYIREMEQDLAERRKSLKPLKSGQMRLGERIGADPWIDITQREIDRREKTIAVYEALLVRLRAEREASRKHRLKDRAPRPPR